MIDYYRIWDETDNEILADKMLTYDQAHETLELLKLQYPHNTLHIETYRESSVKPGFGRDPDLH
jgi:hypothetical protein